MARDIDMVIDYVRGMSDHYLPPVMKQVVINRLDPAPTQEEIDRAAAQVYPEISFEEMTCMNCGGKPICAGTGHCKDCLGPLPPRSADAPVRVMRVQEERG